MSVVASEASLRTYKSPPTESPPKNHLNPSQYYASSHGFYKIEDMHQSESAWILFVRHTVTKKTVVMKMLRNYKDMRYSLEEVYKRQQCQLEALQWNRLFTHGIYLGLAPYNPKDLDLRRKCIRVDEIIKDPTKEMLAPNSDYALIMYKLPEERRLDFLLSEDHNISIGSELKLLVERIVDMHLHLTVPSIAPKDGMPWGCFEQLQSKLADNLTFLDYALNLNKNSLYNTFYNNTYYEWLKLQRSTLPQLFTQSNYQQYFEQRIKMGCIRRCHGDLKAPNIWIASHNQLETRNIRERVWLLDAIDFNPMFSNIDILSDFAMLVIDVQVRTNSSYLVNQMIEEYLQLTRQDDEISRSILTYYLFEKAIVGSAVSIVDDKMPSFSQTYFAIAMKCLEDLKHRINSTK